MNNNPLPPLAAVALSAVRVDPRLATVAHLISDFLGVSPSLSLVHAAASGAIKLFDRVAVRLRNADTDPELRAFHFARAMHVALERDDLAMLQRIHLHHPEPLFVDHGFHVTSMLRASTLELAFRYGTLETVQWVIAHRHDRLCNAMPGITSVCRGCLVSALHEIGDRDVFCIVMWLLESGVFPPMTKRLIPHFSRALELSVDLVRWAHERNLLGKQSAVRLLEHAVRCNKPATCAFLLAKGYRLEPRDVKIYLIRAATKGHEAIVHALIASGQCEELQHKFSWAPWRPHGAKILQWREAFMDEQCMTSFTTGEFIQLAAYMDLNVEMLQWFRAKRNMTTLRTFPWDEGPGEAALLRLYRWLKRTGQMDHVNGYDVGVAARHGYLQVLQWLHVHLPSTAWTSSAMDAAAVGGQLPVLKWLHHNRSEGCTVDAMNNAAGRGDLDIVKWLYDHQTEHNVSAAIREAANGGHLDVLVWLLDRTDTTAAVCTTRIIQATLTSVDRVLGKPPSPVVIRWLETHATPRCKTCGTAAQDAKDKALTSLLRRLDRDLDVARFLYDRVYDKQRITIKRHAVTSIATSGHLPLLQWVVGHVHKAERRVDPQGNDDWDGEWPEILVGALHSGQDHIVDWIRSVDDKPSSSKRPQH